MILLRFLLIPISFLYGIITWFRNKLFDFGVLHQREYNIPLISLGNITVGGTGKTPHVEYLVRLLTDKFELATLSRGYGRKSKGFVLADNTSSYKDIGDEPLQFASKFENLKVAVDENRRNGIEKLQSQFPSLQAILLDDCFQHRYVKPGLNILLIDYHTVDERQFMLPSGMLREYKSGSKRADIIIVTKSPSIFSPIEKRRIDDLIQPKPHQKVYYSYIDYKNIIAFTPAAKKLLKDNPDFNISDYKTLVFAGIANITPLTDYLNDNAREVIVSQFVDHHEYNMADLIRIGKEYNEIILSKKIMITTEKDAMRLKSDYLYPVIAEYPLFYIPIEVSIHQQDREFDEKITSYVESYL